MTILEAAAALRARQVSSVELTTRCLETIARDNPKLNAFLAVTEEQALADARRADAEFAEGRDRGPMQGIPIAHKDLFCTNSVKTTSGSKVFAEYVPNFDAAVVEKLRDAGAVMMGKTNMHEHAYGITSNNPHFGPVRNPWDPERIPGGSSGGSAVAVASEMALGATGSDTGGSIRVPASYCGIAGLKPTFGLVSKFGALPLGFSLDHAGPMARTVRDVAAMLEAMAGHDARDGSSVRRKRERYVPGREEGLAGVRIALPQNFFFERLDAEVQKLVLGAAQAAEEGGATFVMSRVPDGQQLNTIAQVTLLAEAASVHEPYIRKRRGDYGADVLALLDMGRLVPATDYLQAQRLRKRILQVFLELLKKVDCILMPVTPVAAPKIGQDTVEIQGQPEDVRLASTRLVRGINALGLPALAFPAGFTAAGLPVGLQLVGRPFSEANLLRVGAAMEDRIGLAGKRGQANA
jgi:aspartyl-tRNA(Asn)/glutamyl-tRNA(Gln) amidotransferase subunit A